VIPSSGGKEFGLNHGFFFPVTWPRNFLVPPYPSQLAIAHVRQTSTSSRSQRAPALARVPSNHEHPPLWLSSRVCRLLLEICFLTSRASPKQTGLVPFGMVISFAPFKICDRMGHSPADPSCTFSPPLWVFFRRLR